MLTYNYPVTELIKTRISWRSYKKESAIEYEKRKALVDACTELKQGLLKERVKFWFVEKNQTNKDGEQIGDYGLLKNIRYFLVGGIETGKLAYESYGYLLEQLVLKANELELQTCWLGYFEPAYFADLPLYDNQIIPAIVVLGYAADQRSFQGRIARFAIGAAKRQEWKKMFFHTRFGTELSYQQAGVYAEALEMLRLAPSSGNTQPWRIIKDADKPVFHFYIKAVKKSYNDKHLHNIDLGIAMAHFELTNQENDIKGHWEVLSPQLNLPAKTTYRISWVGD